MKISISVLNIDFKNLRQTIEVLESAGIDSWHMDIMDGHFVDNISFGPDVVKTVNEISDLPIFTHLMIKNPEKHIDKYFEAGSEIVTVHAEVLNDDNIDILEKENIGISFNPDYPLPEIFPYLEKVKEVLVMSVFAGFGGQEFIEDSLARISQLDERKKELGLDFKISVDGGINAKNALSCLNAGANEVIIGTFVTKSQDPAEKIKEIQENIKSLDDRSKKFS
ncbi:ribulose-phosphate 3-epimerase [Elusimicrobiota bacterium]